MILGIDCSRLASERPTGVELYTDRVLEGLIQRADQLGYDEVRCYVRNARQVEQLLFWKDKYRAEKTKVRLIECKRLWTYLGLSWELFRRPVDAFFEPSHVLPWFAPKRSVLTVHGVEALLLPQAYSWFLRWYQRHTLLRAKRIGARFIAVSQAVKNDLVRLLGIEEGRIAVVYNGFDEVGSREFGVGSLEIQFQYILHVGRLEERKNQIRLIDAFEQIAGEFSELELVLVGGDGQGAENIKLKIKKLECKKRIHLMGYQMQEVVRSLMKHARVFAYPSLAEGFGIPILEAFSAGTPVLTSRGSACEEVAGGAAVLCDPLDVQSIANGLRKLLSDENLRKEKIEGGALRLRSGPFSWEKCVEGVVGVLADGISG
ncbi:MAG: glycosyltransferase family 1 protein [bacterium]|nr:glycosyltransferase family 1 protein [bacterium]